MATVRVIGATGNIDISAISAVLRTKQKALAIARNQKSADKVVKNFGSKEGIAFVEADVTSDTDVQSVVEQVRQGKLPAFQHVYSCGMSSPGCSSVYERYSNTRETVGGKYTSTRLLEIITEMLRRKTNAMFEANLCAYLSHPIQDS